MKTYSAKVTRKGQITIPVEVRRHLDLCDSDRVIVSISDDGIVELRKSEYPDLLSIRGAAGKLEHPLPWEEVIRIAREDALLDDPEETYE